METKIRRVLPIRQDITYWFCFTGAETEIHKIKDDSKIKREKNIDRRGQRHIVNFWHLSDPPSFSLPTSFKIKINLYQAEQNYVRGELVRNCHIHDLNVLTEEKGVLSVFYKVPGQEIFNRLKS
jgi:hypothetical protein